MVYINYMANWENGTDEEIQPLIDELNLFKGLGDFKSDSAIDDEFSTLVSLAETVRDETIAVDAIQIAADAAAVASFWSFGLSMAAFAALEATEQIMKQVISSKSKDLNNKLKTVDVDIASKIDSKVYTYVADYKKNNNLISSQSPKGLDLQQSRSNLMQFMAQVERRFQNQGGLTVENFKRLAASARLAFDSDEINKVYDALDELNLSPKLQEDVNKLMNTLKGLDFKGEAIAKEAVMLVQGISISIAAKKLNVAKEKITTAAEEAEIPVEEFESSAFSMMDAVGKFAVGVAVAMSVVDVVMNIIDIVDIVEQSKKMVDELNDTIKPSYKQFFDGIKASSKAYNEAISKTS